MYMYVMCVLVRLMSVVVCIIGVNLVWEFSY